MNNKEDNKQTQDHHLARVASQVVFKYFKLFLLASVVLIMGLGFIFVLKPKYDDINNNIRISNSNLKEQIKVLEGNKQVLQDYRESFRRLTDMDTKRLDKFLPAEFDRDSLFAQMEALIVGQGYTLNSLTVADISQQPAEGQDGRRGRTAAAEPAFAPPAGIGIYELNLEVAGLDYRGVKNLLAVLEKSLQLYDVIDLSFAEGGESANLKIYTYYLL